MSGVLILGAGGHGKVVADILLCQRVPLLGFLDDNPATWKSECLGLPVLGAIESYQDYKPTGLVLGIGNNRVRQKIVERLSQEAEGLWINAIHPTAILADSVQLGNGVVIAAGTVVNPDTVLGDHLIVNTGATIDHDCVIEEYVHLAPGVHLAGGVKVGQGTLIGIGAAVIPYRSIGCWATVGAGAVVVRDISNKVIAKGVPARW